MPHDPGVNRLNPQTMLNEPPAASFAPTKEPKEPSHRSFFRWTKEMPMDTRDGDNTPATDGTDSEGKRKLKHDKEQKGDRQRQQQFE